MEYRARLEEARNRIVEVEPSEAARQMPSSTVVDVREPNEIAAGRIEGSINVKPGDVETAAPTLLPDRHQSIIVYCEVGERSALVTDALGTLGYENVVNLAGGFRRWVATGHPWLADSGLTLAQHERYSRHTTLAEVGVAGQQKLLAAKVLVVGAGGLGSPAALYLAAAGIGTIGLVDDDVVDISNLQRQILHTTGRVGVPKTDSAAMTIADLNPDVDVNSHPVRLAADNVLDILDGYDVVVDGADNFPTRYLVNDASLHTGQPIVHGSIFRFEGQASVFSPYAGPCYRCLFREPPPPELAPNCAAAGVLGVLPGVIGSIQATEAVKLILGIGEPLVGRLLLYDALDQETRTLTVRRDPDCPACGDPDRKPVLVDYDERCLAT